MKIHRSYIDKCTNWLKRDRFANGYTFVDPRNPHDLNKRYEKALVSLSKRKCESVCVVYDALSDFLCFTDEQIAIQYLRHNMYWEEEKNVSSIYLFRQNTVQNKFLEEYIIWFAKAVFYFEVKGKKPCFRIRGLFKGPKSYKIDYDMNLDSNENEI
jgi:hypothetical protein